MLLFLGVQCFSRKRATTLYPAGIASWTGKLQNYGGTDSWEFQPGQVTGVKAISADAASIKLTWTEVSGATANTYTGTGLTLNNSYGE